MSKNKGKQTKSTELDPQTLFQQFAPVLYFDIAKPSTRPDWFIIGEQSVPVEQFAFEETVVK